MNQLRIAELDLLRGLSVIGMILVISPGRWGVGYDWLNHADWEGLVAVDMIAPVFLFCIGFAIPISLRKRLTSASRGEILLQVFKRSCLLIGIGLSVEWLATGELSTIRIPGVLQRIGLSYAIVASTTLFLIPNKTSNEPIAHLNTQKLVIIFTSLLIGYWALFYFVPTPIQEAIPQLPEEIIQTSVLNQSTDSTLWGAKPGAFSSDASWASYVDQLLFGIHHMWPYGTTNGEVTFDPDGLLCTISTCGNVLIGVIIGNEYMKSSRFAQSKYLLGLAIGLVIFALLFTTVCPAIKKIWSSSYVLFSSGISIFLLVGLRYLAKIKQAKLITVPLYIFGSNALLAFIISWVGLVWGFDQVIYNDQSIRSLVYEKINSYFSHPPLSSLLFGILVLSALALGLSFLYKKRLYLRL